jgi:SHS family lactate transporter-like MFS transporter
VSTARRSAITIALRRPMRSEYRPNTIPPTLGLLVAGAFIMQFMVQGAWGVIPAHITELSGDSVRGFLPGFAYQCGVLIASSIVYIEPRIAEHTSYANAMSISAVTVFVLAAIAAWFGRERRGVIFGEG